MSELLKNCQLCPRKCGVNRYEKVGVCGASNKVKLAYYNLHKWEEPIISGVRGSGTVFFSNCSMKCIYCQNKKISQDGYGKYISNKRLGEIFLTLQDKGAHNINLVTPTHYVPQIASVLQKIKGKSLNIPVIYNTSSYECVGTIMMMRGLVDVYLADLRYFDDELGKRYSLVDNYFETATMAIDEMYRQVGKPKFDKDGMLLKGLVVRVLVIPGHTRDAKEIINYLYKTYKDDIYISIMNQYTPVNKCKFDNLNRRLTDKEYDEIIDFAVTIGVNRAFIQEGEAASESFIPKFDCSKI